MRTGRRLMLAKSCLLALREVTLRVKAKAQASNLQSVTTMTVQECRESVAENDPNCTSPADVVRVVEVIAPMVEAVSQPIANFVKQFI